MAVLLAAAMLVAQVASQDAPDDASVDTTVETVLEVEATPAPATVPLRTVWTQLAMCESSGRWHINSGNGYSGGLQMDSTFWRRHGGLQYASAPYLASVEQQVAVAERGLAVQGWIAWPACSRRLGLR